jgi:hypothetical protein
MAGDPNSPFAEDYDAPDRSPMQTPTMAYNPQHRFPGVDYWQIGQILRILETECELQSVQTLVQDALRYSPEGYALRNDYLNPIRVQLQGWRVGWTLSSMVKNLLQMLLIDTRDGKLAIETLTLDTLLAYDPSGKHQQERYA